MRSSRTPNRLFCGAEVLNFGEVFYHFFYSWIMLSESSLRTHHQASGPKETSLFFSKMFVVLHFTFKSMIHLN